MQGSELPGMFQKRFSACSSVCLPLRRDLTWAAERKEGSRRGAWRRRMLRAMRHGLASLFCEGSRAVGQQMLAFHSHQQRLPGPFSGPEPLGPECPALQSLPTPPPRCRWLSVVGLTSPGFYDPPLVFSR